MKECYELRYMFTFVHSGENKEIFHDLDFVWHIILKKTLYNKTTLVIILVHEKLD